MEEKIYQIICDLEYNNEITYEKEFFEFLIKTKKINVSNNNKIITADDVVIEMPHSICSCIDVDMFV